MMIIGRFVSMEEMEQWLGAVQAYYAAMPCEPSASDAIAAVRDAFAHCRFVRDGVLYVAGDDILRR